MNMNFEPEVEELVEVALDIDQEKERDLIVYNDDYNTFDHVTSTLIKVCKHRPIQAEQCTYIIHYKGKCLVKKGSYEILKPMREAISEAGIKAIIE